MLGLGSKVAHSLGVQDCWARFQTNGLEDVVDEGLFFVWSGPRLGCQSADGDAVRTVYVCTVCHMHLSTVIPMVP